MDKTSFLTIFASFENLDIVQQTLPTVVAETRAHDGKLIVHDSSERGRDEKWAYLKELNRNHDFFLILSDNLSMAHARNMCLAVGLELYAPDHVCMLEDDHGYHPGFIPAMMAAMREHYGQVSPNGLRIGLFSGCAEHNRHMKLAVSGGHRIPDEGNAAAQMGRANSCCRCAPAHHWLTVLKGYDTDEYPISTFQTNGLNQRNYQKGFTALLLEDGQRMFSLENKSRGSANRSAPPLWDDVYAASDRRSRFAGKDGTRDG